MRRGEVKALDAQDGRLADRNEAVQRSVDAAAQHAAHPGHEAAIASAVAWVVARTHAIGGQFVGPMIAARSSQRRAIGAMFSMPCEASGLMRDRPPRATAVKGHWLAAAAASAPPVTPFRLGLWRLWFRQKGHWRRCSRLIPTYGVKFDNSA
ncbi:MAG: hypothetical protein J2P48_04525 [Alphaproteobacteria bacterium]|nr:hypothetical protein [Alphaproteobacteria bacterium]